MTKRKPSVYRKIRGIRDGDIIQSITSLQNQINEVKGVVGALVQYINANIPASLSSEPLRLPAGDGDTIEGETVVVAPDCTVCGMEATNPQHLAACPDDAGAHDYQPFGAEAVGSGQEAVANQSGEPEPAPCPDCHGTGGFEYGCVAENSADGVGRTYFDPCPTCHESGELLPEDEAFINTLLPPTEEGVVARDTALSALDRLHRDDDVPELDLRPSETLDDGA